MISIAGALPAEVVYLFGFYRFAVATGLSDGDEGTMGVTWVLVGLGSAALAAALLLGGRQERVYAVAKAIATLCNTFLGTNSSPGAIPRDAVIDLALLAVVLPLALKSSKLWPLAAASLCIATLMTAAAQMLIHATPSAYGIAQGGWDLLAGLVVAAGAWNVWRARRRSDDQVPDHPIDAA